MLWVRLQTGVGHDAVDQSVETPAGRDARVAGKPSRQEPQAGRVTFMKKVGFLVRSCTICSILGEP